MGQSKKVINFLDQTIFIKFSPYFKKISTFYVICFLQFVENPEFLPLQVNKVIVVPVHKDNLSAFVFAAVKQKLGSELSIFDKILILIKFCSMSKR